MRRQSATTLLTLLFAVLLSCTTSVPAGEEGAAEESKSGGSKELAESRIQSSELSLQKLEKEILMYRIRLDAYPARIEDLLNSPGGDHFVTRLPTDAWGRELALKTVEQGVVISSAGPDGVHGNTDDLSLTVSDR